MTYFRSFAVLVVAIVSGLLAGTVGYTVILVMTDDARSSIRLGFGIGVLFGLAILGYGNLWEERSRRPEVEWGLRPRWGTKREGKLQTAEVRAAFAFGVVAYFSTETTLPTTGVVLAVTSCALAGAFLGYDIKRRVGRIRQRRQAQLANVGEGHREHAANTGQFAQ
jgi:membrane protein DedA with SNARE-associated domain